MARTLRIRRGDLDNARAHAREGAPDEVCGILAGRRLPDGTAKVEQLFRTRNAHARPRGEYLVHPEDQLKVLLHAEDDLGLEIVGFYHSHPAGPARLSTTDAARANWPGASYLLVWLAPVEGVGSWRWDEGENRFEPEEIVVLDEGAFAGDASAGRVHRRATARPACALAHLREEDLVDIADEFKATMVMKTRHWRACEHCWPG